MTSSYLNEMYDVTGVNVFLSKLMKFHRKKRLILCLPHYCNFIAIPQQSCQSTLEDCLLKTKHDSESAPGLFAKLKFA